MHNQSIDFSALQPGTDLGELRVVVSLTANERYWRAAGADHPALRSGVLYPPIAANVSVLLFGQACPEPVIQAAQRLRCHRAAAAPAELVATGRVVACYEKRDRAYVDLEVQVATTDSLDPMWDSAVTFTPAATVRMTA
jgi:hypothetical protein